MQPGNTSRAWYASSIDAFRAKSTEEILGTLAANSGFDVARTQRDAWIAEINFLRERLGGLTGAILFEFSIPRMGRRIDVVLLLGGIVFVVEFKIGATTYDSPAIDQTWDYALDLKNFHEASHHLTIVPLLVAPDALEVAHRLTLDPDGVARPLRANRRSFRDLLDLTASRFGAEQIDVARWALRRIVRHPRSLRLRGRSMRSIRLRRSPGTTLVRRISASHHSTWRNSSRRRSGRNGSWFASSPGCRERGKRSSV